jgi:hypothetical protein
MKVPILVHRWFAKGGAGWACHPDLVPHLTECQICLTNQLNGDVGTVGPVQVTGASLVLVGLRLSDPDRATDKFNRPLRLVCAAALAGFPANESEAEIRNLLQKSTLPTHAGVDALLELEWPGSVIPLQPSLPPKPIAELKPQTRPRTSWVARAAIACLILLVILFVVVRFWPIQPKEKDSHASQSESTASSKVDNSTDATSIEAVNKKRNILRLWKIANEGDSESIQQFVSENDFSSLDGETKEAIGNAIIERCNRLRSDEGSRFESELTVEFENFQDPDEVLRAVKQAEKRIGILGNAAEKLGVNIEWDSCDYRESVEIERLRYGRILYCWTSLKKEISGDRKKGEWQAKFTELQLSVDEFRSRRNNKVKEVRNTVDALSAWCVYIDSQTTNYKFVITFPNKWKWKNDKTNEKFVEKETGNEKSVFFWKRMRASKENQRVELPITLKAPSAGGEDIRTYWRIGSRSTALTEHPNIKVTLDGCDEFALPDCKRFPSSK